LTCSRSALPAAERSSLVGSELRRTVAISTSAGVRSAGCYLASATTLEGETTLRIGIGLPNTVLDVPGRLVVGWARRAEERGFSSLATIDRVAYPSYDSLSVLTAAAGATERIGLVTNILVEPVYTPVLLAKVTASLDQLSGGRLTLGLGVGGRADDFQVTGRSFDDRGRRFDADLELLHAAWAGEPVAGSPFPVGPRATRGRVPLLIGGQAELAARRAARWDAGFTVVGAPPEMAGGAIREFRKAWEAAGGTGQPRVLALSYFSLGKEHTAESLHNLRTYYGFLGDWAEQVAQGVPRTPDAVRRQAAAFEEAGVDELIFDPTVADLDQVDLLADAIG
jgi:alkanesulfonate monooxygenase SsuD/methylene tetrahydromethanopterin reductase-like flavin-dependent oxidoreductase (luciferase family)